MADQTKKQTEKILSEMEKEVSDIYRRASDEISEKWNKYMESHQKKVELAYEDLQLALKSGDKDEIAEAKSVYERTVKNVTLNNERYKAMVDETTARIAHTNEIALDYVNGDMAKVYTLGYNEFSNQDITGYTFTIVNERAIQNLAKNDKSLLPKKKLDIPKDKAWNTKKINSEVLQGILQGENIPKIAKRLQNVTDMNKKSAVRNARTMVTGAENKGRQDSFKKAEKDGIILKRRWVAAIDDRTRAWHSDLNGVEVDSDEPWENDYGKIMYPGDPTADPANVYNCRCSIRAVVKGFDWSKQNEESFAEEERYIDLSDESYEGTTEHLKKISNLDEWKEKIEDLEYNEEIGKYSGEYYATTNDYLRSGEFRPTNKYMSQDTIDDIIYELDTAISEFDLKKPITVYRSSGTEIFGAEDLSYDELRSRIGSRVHDNAYLSTSTLKELPGEQTVGGNVRYIIDVPEGKGHGAYIARFSENHQEREFLMAREGDYEISDVFRDKDGRTTVRMKYLGSNADNHITQKKISVDYNISVESLWGNAKDVMNDDILSGAERFSRRLKNEDVAKFNKIFNEAEFEKSNRGNGYNPADNKIYIESTGMGDSLMFHESTHWFDYNQKYEIKDTYDSFRWVENDDGEFVKVPETKELLIKERGSFSEYISHKWTKSGEDYSSLMGKDLKNFVDKIGTSDKYGPDRGWKEAKKDMDAVKSYLEKAGIDRADQDFVHLSDFISAISYDANNGSLGFGGHSYDYWTQNDANRVAEITAGYNVLKSLGREDLLDIERELAPNLMKLIEEEWNKIW